MTRSGQSPPCGVPDSCHGAGPNTPSPPRRWSEQQSSSPTAIRTSRACLLDAVYSEVVEQLEAGGVGSWQEGLRTVAQANWDLYMRHPWVLQIFTGRPPLGPHAIAKYDRELRMIDGTRLSDVEMDAVITLVHTHVEGVARRRIDADRVVRRTGISDAQWWQRVQPALAEVFDPSQFPVAARVGEAAGQAHQAAHNPEYAFAFGLDRLIQGVQSLIETKATSPGRT